MHCVAATVPALCHNQEDTATLGDCSTMAELRRATGFTLIEVMIVLVVIAILAGLALPSYLDSVQRARRGDGQASLLRLQLEQEKWRANNLAYTSSLSDLGLSDSSADGFYTIAITFAGASGFTATASASGSQSGDVDCQTLTLAHAGANTSTTPTACWRK